MFKLYIPRPTARLSWLLSPSGHFNDNFLLSTFERLCNAAETPNTKDLQQYNIWFQSRIHNHRDKRESDFLTRDMHLYYMWNSTRVREALRLVHKRQSYKE